VVEGRDEFSNGRKVWLGDEEREEKNGRRKDGDIHGEKTRRCYQITIRLYSG
jgi:hypothetical protein